jgi:ClpP class serine protease
MSGGTMIALSADEIVIDENAALGPVDPQIGQYPAASLVEVVAQKPIEHIKDETLVLVDVARKALRQVDVFLTGVLENKMDTTKAKKLAHDLSSGLWTHDYPITVGKLKGLGLPIQEGLPREVYSLMELSTAFNNDDRVSVQYIPTPYDGGRNTSGRSNRDLRSKNYTVSDPIRNVAYRLT